MVTYYIESPTGKYVSEDGKRRFDRYTGTSAYEYLNSEEAAGKRFFKTFPYEDPYHEVYIEIPSRFVKEYRQEERHEQYLNDVANESSYIIIPINGLEINHRCETVSLEEFIADDSVDVENEVIYSLMLETLRFARSHLAYEDNLFLDYLFSDIKEYTEAEIGRFLGMTQQAVNKRKKEIFKKIRKFF